MQPGKKSNCGGGGGASAARSEGRVGKLPARWGRVGKLPACREERVGGDEGFVARIAAAARRGGESS